MRDALAVARELIGKTLVRTSAQGTTSGVIVETEAYLGERDDAAHTYKGRTERTRVAYEAGGRAYIYLIYGAHCCLNITANESGVPEMVLLRAIEPLEGVELMRERRGKDDITSLCSGPGKLCAAMDVDRSLYAEDLCASDRLFILDAPLVMGVAATPRKNIAYAEKCRNEPWRFILEGSGFVSK